MTLTTALGPPAVYTRIDRPDPALVLALSAFSASTVHEANQRLGFMRGIAPRVQGATICGPAITSLDHAGDNIMIHATVETAQPGDILVIATKSPSAHGMFGDLLAEQCRAHGIGGVVSDAGIRDVAQLREMPFPAWSRSISMDGTAKANAGWSNVPVVCGGQIVRPGDVILADDDGVVVVAKEALADVVRVAEAREAKEAKSRQRYANGESSLDVAGLRKTVEALGVVYPDREGG